MEFISTKDMTNDTAPEGKVLVKFLEPSFGGWSLDYMIGYFDNPNDYEDDGGAGWLSWYNDQPINVVSYCVLDKITQKENPWSGIKQIETQEIHGTFFPNLGSVQA